MLQEKNKEWEAEHPDRGVVQKSLPRPTQNPRRREGEKQEEGALERDRRANFPKIMKGIKPQTKKLREFQIG